MDIKKSAIARFSLFFIKKYRVTLILFFTILSLGYFSYSSLLVKEGFPSIEVPVVSIQGSYFVNDANKVDQQLTLPIESSLESLESIQEISSISNDNFSFVNVVLESGTDTEAAKQEIRRQVEDEVGIPESAQIEYVVFDAGSIDGTNNLVLNLSGDSSISELQDKAIDLAKELESNEVVEAITVNELITEQVNPVTGQNFEFQDQFNRVGRNTSENLEFSQAISIGIKANENFDTIEISTSIRDQINDLEEQGFLDNYFVTFGQDFAEILDDQIASLESNALSGFIAVIIVLLLLVNWRASLVTAIFIPTVLAASFLVLYLTGYSLNVISLFSLILVLGLFVDDAIVVVEAIDLQKKKGKKGLEAVTQAINDIGVADVLGSATTILVFAPILFASGVLGDFIALIPITVIISLLCSLFIALSIIPLFTNAAIPDRDKKIGVIGKSLDRFFGLVNQLILKISEIVGGFVEKYLSKISFTLLIGTLGLLLIGLGMFYAGKISFNIFPASKDSNEISINISFDEEKVQDIAKAEQIVKDVEKIIAQEIGDNVQEVVYYRGDVRGAQMLVILTDYSERNETSTQFVDSLNEKFTDITSAEVDADKVSVGPPANEYPFAIQIKDEDIQVLETAAQDITEFIQSVELSGGVQVLDVRVENSDSINRLNGNRFLELRAKFSDNNTSIPLELQGKIEEKYTSEELERLGLSDESLAFDFGQDSENLESFQSLAVAGLISIVLIYILLVWQFNSFVQPFLILFAIPLSFPGLFIGLYLMNIQFSFFVLVGLIGLAGIVVNNTIMLVDYANQAKEHKEGVDESIAHAIKLRFRPLVTTSITTLAGLLPLALSEPFWEPLAYTIIFGLLSSTILVILVFPAFFSVFEKLSGKVKMPVYAS